MKANELIAQMLAEDPEVLQGVPERKAMALIRSVFKHINGTLASLDEGVVKYAGLGQFRVRKVIKESEAGQESQNRIAFRLAAQGKRKGGQAEDEEGDD